jgi:sugar phosphate isomerase/epimerase
MYASERSVVNTIEQANAIARELDPHNDGFLGVAVDVYHCWWDPALETGVASLGDDKRIFAYHVSDWLVPTTDMLLDRGMMGDGVIDLQGFRQAIEKAGYAGMVEVEIFSRDNWWKLPPDQILQTCAARLRTVC